MIAKRGLGRGLNEILSMTKSATEGATPPSATHHLPIEKLQAGKYQPRKDMSPDALQELADSIKVQGIIQPIIVRPMGERYEIIAGERRWRAAQLAGLLEVPVIVREIPDEAAIAMALIENIQREDLNAIEEAEALQRLGAEFELSHEEIAHAVGKSRATITNLLRLLNLGSDVKQMLAQGELDMGHARALLSLNEAQQGEAARMIFAKGLSVRETEQLVRKLQSNPVTTTKAVAEITDPAIERLQASFVEKLKTKIAIQAVANGKGKLVIHFDQLAELEDLLDRII